MSVFILIVPSFRCFVGSGGRARPAMTGKIADAAHVLVILKFAILFDSI